VALPTPPLAPGDVEHDGEQGAPADVGVTTTPQATACGLFQNLWYSKGLPIMAAKTGTAEPQKNVCGTDNWLISFGPAALGQVPRVAIATVVPIPSNSLSCSTNPTGAAVAGPVELPVLEQALAQQG
jgi:cell division protein FtsI/penicillin-binding protein 2